MSEPIRLMSISQERIERILELKEENPDASHYEIAWLAFDSKDTVGKVLKGVGEAGRKPIVAASFRERKCCPACGSLSIERRIRAKRYFCTKCRDFFTEPASCLTADVPYPQHKIPISQ